MDWLFGTKYKVWVVNTTSKAEIYLWTNFESLLPNLNTLLNLSKHDAYIRTFQSYELQNRWLGFGRMKWNRENNLNWTTKYSNSQNADDRVEFFSTEIWAPSWKYCCDNGKNPELFISIYNNENFENLREGILIAMPKKLTEKHADSVESAISKIAERIPNSSLSTEERKWTSSRKFPNGIEDMNVHDMNVHELEKIVYKNISVSQ